jgi:hypothetical protein
MIEIVLLRQVVVELRVLIVIHLACQELIGLCPVALAVWCLEVALGSRLILIHDQLVVDPHLVPKVRLSWAWSMLGIVFVWGQKVIEVLLLLLVLAYDRARLHGSGPGG